MARSPAGIAEGAARGANGRPAPNQLRRGDTPAIRIGKRIRKPVNRWIARSSKVPNAPFLDARGFAWARLLEDNWRTVRAELDALIDSGEAFPPLGRISPDHRRIAGETDWRSFFFEAYGYRLGENRARCPATAALLDSIPDLVLAFFSIMEPGAYVPRHKGVTKALLNAHLALMVPDPPGSARISCGKQTREWREGELLLFDDTYKHEVWNDGPTRRVVLLVQVRRPVRWWGRLLGSLFLAGVKRTSYVQEGREALLHAKGADKAAGRP